MDTSVFDKIDFTQPEFLKDLNLRAIKFKRNKVKKWWMRPIEPDSSFRASWDLIGMFLILYEAIFIPYRVCFNRSIEGPFLMFEYCIDMFFIIDICKLVYGNFILGLNFYTGFYKKG